jgi:hypothetical protein
VLATAPTISQPNIIGTTTNNNASAGSVGEFVSSNVPNSSAVPLTTLVAANVTSISLTAGDWDVDGTVVLSIAGNSIAIAQAGVNSVSATQPDINMNANGTAVIYPGVVVGQQMAIPTGMRRFSIATTTTIYLIATAVFSGGTATACGFIRARRIR